MSRKFPGAFLAALGVCSAAARPCAADSLYFSDPSTHQILKVAENRGVSIFSIGYATPEQLVFDPFDAKIYVADAGPSPRSSGCSDCACWQV
jgi:hypothetical protein